MDVDLAARSRIAVRRFLTGTAMAAALAAAALAVGPIGRGAPLVAVEADGRAAHAAGAADLVWSTFLGGAGREDVYALAVDAAGAVYVGGETTSAGLATAGAAGASRSGGQDGFVAKIAPGGDRLEFLTYLGGSATDYVTDLVVDRDGSLLVAGYTTSRDFPVTAGAYDPTYRGAIDGFAARLDATGRTVLAATYLGGRENDYAETVRLDDAGNVYVSGETWSPNFRVTPGAFQTALGGSSDAFVARLDAGLSALGYATYLGGRGDDCADCSMDVSAGGEVTLVSRTSSTDMPTSATAFDRTLAGGFDAWVGRLDAGGGQLRFGTYLGGSGNECDEGCYVDVDADGTTVLVGNTYSMDFPSVPAAPPPTRISRDAVAVRLSADGARLIASRRFAGAAGDLPRDVAVAPGGDVLLVARTDSADFPVTPDGFDPTYNGAGDVAMLRLDGATLAVRYGTFLGGAAGDGGWRPRVLPAGPGRVAVAGTTRSGDFPTTAGAHDRVHAGDSDAFALLLEPGTTATAVIPPTATATDTATIPPTATATDTATIPPTATATDTATIAPSATATPTMAPTATATATPTPAVYRAYLPLGLYERCPPPDRFVDVVLVVDASTSMREPAPGGGTKLEAAVAAVRAFLAGMRLGPGMDRAALVAFNDEARTLAPLSHDAAALSAALDAVTIRERSRLDLGIARAAQLLAAPRPDGERVMVVLSDGRANPVSGAEVRLAAEIARSAGILAFAVGFGDVLDEALLRDIAGAPERYAAARSPAALEGVFRRLVVEVPCSPEAFWPRRDEW